LGVLLAGAPVVAGPGDPFGGDDTGCVPSTTQGLRCARSVGTLLVKLRRSVLNCHFTQVGLALQTGHSSPGFDNSEENCEVGNPSNSAKATFDDKIASLAADGCSATLIANANAARDLVLADQNAAGSLDNLNGAFFCDSTSGVLIADNTGTDQDEAGWIPSTAGHYKCGIAIAKSWNKLDNALVKCHQKLAAYGFKGAPFDEEACETGSKGALTKYSLAVTKYIDAGFCAPCQASFAPSLGTDTAADADANLEDLYICPGP